MRFLKNKIARAMECAKAVQQKQVKLEPTLEYVKIEQAVLVKHEETSSVKTQPFTPKRTPKSPETSVKSASTPVKRKRESNANKNIVKNYARAMVNFALSNVATATIEDLIKQENNPGINLRTFRKFMDEQKEEVTSIRRLRELLLPCDQDEEVFAGFKRIFKEIGMIFIRDFSLNWIYNSKVGDKLTHVKYRFKMMRRVQNPEYFTYIENFAKK